MKLSRILYHASGVSLSLFVALQFISFEPDRKKVAKTDIAAQIQSEWESLKRKNLVSGTILIQQNKKTIFSDGDLNKPYSIASISKTFSGHIFSELEKNGDINLDSAVCKWLANFCDGQLGQITVNHLLNHTSGFGRDLNFLYSLKIQFGRSWNSNNIDELKLSDGDLKSKPGEKFQYSNFGYTVLSRILELNEKRTFANIISKWTSENNLRDTRVINTESLFEQNILMPFSNITKTFYLSSNLDRVAGAGGIQSTAADLIKWLDLAEKDFAFLFQNLDSDGKQNYHRGWVKSQKQSFTAYWHNGATLGNYSFVGVIPDSDLKIVILTDNYKLIKYWADRAQHFQSYFY